MPVTHLLLVSALHSNTVTKKDAKCQGANKPVPQLPQPVTGAGRTLDETNLNLQAAHDLQ